MAEALHREARLLQGTPASAGIAVGKLYLVEETAPVDTTHTDDEESRLVEALDVSTTQLTDLLNRLDDQSEAVQLLEFQLAMIEDETLCAPALSMTKAGHGAYDAWSTVLDAEIADYAAADDEYFQARVSDLKDIRDRVRRVITGVEDISIPANCVVVADDISPSQFLSTYWGRGGIALTGGSPASHVAMLARASNVPMIVNLSSAPAPGTGEIFLDAHAGELVFDATASEREVFVKRIQQDELQRQEESEYLYSEVRTSDGDRVLVQINVADPGELGQIDVDSCDGVGLVRTEFLFHQNDVLPSETEQFDVYRRFIEWARGKPVTVRTLDAGGDKPITGVTIDSEKNPFLGVRGIRLSLLHAELFRTQLRALLRASAHGPLKIMLPMVTVPDEVEQARTILCAERDALIDQEIAVGDPELGIMVEVPSAAISVEDFDADFFSIGSNDLVQYVTACSRDAARLQQLAQPDNPAVVMLIAGVVRHGRRTGREVSVCGEMAGDPRFIGLLLDHGLRCLSVAPAALARAKHAVVCPR